MKRSYKKAWVVFLLALCLASALYYYQTQRPSQPIITESATESKEEPENSVPSPTPSIRLVLLGNSLTAGYGVSAEDAYPAKAEKMLEEKGYHIAWVNASISGSTSASGLSRLRWQLKNQPTHVLLALGSNDGLRGFPLPSIEKHIEAMIIECKKHQVIPLLVGLQVPPNMGAAYSKGFHNLFPKLAKKHNIPLWDFILKDVGGEASKNLADGIHPNALGHEIMAEYFVKFLKQHLPAPK